MREMKYCDIEWEHLIPVGWSETRLKHVLTKLERPVEPDHEIVICSNGGEVVFRGEKNPGLVSMTESGYQGVKSGDLLIHGMDTWHGAIAVSSIEGKCTGVVHVCDSTEDKRFIAYYLKSLAFRNVYKAFSNGVRQNTSDFRSWAKAGTIPIALPKLDEQRAIADYLDGKCTEIDKAIEAAEASIEEYKLYKKSVIFQAVTKGLDPDAPMRDSGIEWIGEVPASWGLVRFKNCYTVHSESGFEDEELLSVYLNRGVIRYGDSDGSQVHKPSASLEKYQLVIPGDLVMNNQQAWRGSVGVSDYRGIISPAYHVYSPNINFDHCRSYMNYFFRSAMVPTFDVHSRGVGTIQRCIAMQYFLNEALLILPDLNEQKRIAAYLDEACLSIDGAIESKQQMIEELKAYKKSLIFETATGKREVPCL